MLACRDVATKQSSIGHSSTTLSTSARTSSTRQRSIVLLPLAFLVPITVLLGSTIGEVENPAPPMTHDSMPSQQGWDIAANTKDS